MRSQCDNCVHRFPARDEGEYGPRCDAFYKGIPDEIINGDFDHTKMFVDDNGFHADHGIRYEARKEI